MAGILDELLVGLGFDYDPKDIEQFNKDLDGSISLIKSFAKAAIAGTAALVGFAAVTTSVTDKQGKLSNQIGVSVDQIDALEFALKRSGGEGSALGGSLEQLSIRLSEASRGIGSGIEAFGILGISVTDANGKLKSTDDVLLEVSDSLQRFSKAEQIELADKLGLRDSILLLQEGSKGIKALTDEAKALGVTTAEDAALSAEFQDSLTDITQIGKQFSRLLTISVVPMLENVANNMTEWWKANKDIIKQNLPKFMERLTFALKLLSLGAAAFISVKLVSTLISMVALFKTLSIRALVANAAIAAIPILIGTIITAIALLAEDAKTFFEGGESFIGDMIEKYPQWADEIRTVAAIFATVYDVTMMIFDGWKQIFSFFSSGTVIEDFGLVIDQLGRDTISLFNNVVDSVSEFFNKLWEDIVRSFTDNVITPIMNKIKAVKEFFSFDNIDLSISNITKSIKETVSTTVQKIIPADVPSIEDIALSIADVPSIEDIALSIADVPSIEDIAQNKDIINGLSNSDQVSSVSNLSSVANDSVVNKNNKSEISIGDIKVDIKAVSDNPAETGKIVAESIKLQLEPLFRQASLDLNSAVEF